MKTYLALLVLVAACSKADKPKGSADWGDDPRPLGACVGTAKPGTPIPQGSESTMCLEKQTKAECTRPSQHFDYVYTEHHTCASVGFEKRCDGGDYPDSTRFKACPSNTREPPSAAATPPAAASPKLEAATQIVAIFEAANAAADETKGDCAAFGKKLAPLRDQLWDLGKANPDALKSLSDAELKSLHAADKLEAIANKLPACKDNVNAKEFTYALGKVI